MYILTTLLSQQELSLKKCVKWFMWKGQKIFREEIVKWYLIHMPKFKEFSSWFKTTFEFDYLNLKPFPSSQTKVSRRTKYLKLIKSLTSHARQITQIWKSLKRYISNLVFSQGFLYLNDFTNFTTFNWKIMPLVIQVVFLVSFKITMTLFHKDWFSVREIFKNLDK